MTGKYEIMFNKQVYLGAVLGAIMTAIGLWLTDSITHPVAMVLYVVIVTCAGYAFMAWLGEKMLERIKRNDKP